MAIPSPATLINEITGTVIFLFSLTLGIVLFVRHKESKARIVFYFALTCIFVSLIYLVFPIRMLSFVVPIADLVYTQIPLSGGYIGLWFTSYMWIGVTFVAAIYLGTELLIPRKFRRWFHISAWVLMISWQLLILFGPNSWLDVEETTVIGDTSFIVLSPPFFVMMFFAVFLLGFLGIGFLVRAIRTGGVLEEKFVILSIGILLMICELAFEGIPDLGDSVPVVLLLRTLMIVGLLLLNYGLYPSRKKRENLKLPREVANLAFYVIGETEELDDQFWNHYIQKSKEMINEYKEKKKDTLDKK